MEINFKEDSNENIETEFEEILPTSSCEICFKNKSQYTCPKCNIPYCSLKCYRDELKHLNCSENFYQDQVITELKMCKISDVEDKNKLAEILLREKEEMENDQFNQHSDFHSNESVVEHIDKVDDRELLKVYMSETNKWSPWWLNEKLKKVLLKEIFDSNSNMISDTSFLNFNKKLVQNSQLVNVSNANSSIYNEILKLSYFYFIVGYVYQLKDEKNVDTSLNDEISFSILQMDKLVNANSQTKDLNDSFDMIIKILSTSSEENFFLKNNINQMFLINLLNDLIFMIKSPNIMLRLLSNVYSIFQISGTKKIHEESEKSNDIENETPINYFHFNKPLENKKTITSLKKSRVEIITKASYKSENTTNNEKKVNQPEIDTKTIVKDSRLFSKKLEYYFKWLCLNENLSKFASKSEKYASDISVLKERLIMEQKEIDEKNTFFAKNIDVFRKNQSKLINDRLIEEI
jgi:hypothetical protein